MNAHDIFRSPNYKINYFYWRIFGFWPFDNYKIAKRVMVLFAMISIMIPQIIRFYEEWHRDVDMAIEIFGNLLYFSGSVAKYLMFLRIETQMATLLDKIANDWKSITDKEEIQILEQYGLASRRSTLGYLIPINIILVVYVTVPLAPVILDLIDPLNETRPRGFPNYVEYFIDDQKYFLYLTVHGWIGCILSVQIFGAFDTTYTCCVQHACALFSIVEIRIKEAAELARNKEYLKEWQQEEMVYRSIKAAILLHKEAIQFIDKIGESYSLTFFLVITLNSAAICLAGVVAIMSLDNGNLKHAIRFGLCYVGYSFHLLYNMSPGQKVIDHSINIGNAVYNSEWYNLSPRTKRLLKIMMMRSSRPCTFTGENMIELNLENFANVFRKSLSYVTVLISMR